MASQKSHLTLQGPLNGVGYYKRNGKYFARTMPKYNQTGSQKKSANSAETLIRRNENMSEFSRSATAARQFITAIAFMPKGMKNRPNLFAEIVKKANEILHLDNGNPRGERTVEFSSYHEKFLDFIFSKKSMSAAFSNPATCTFSDGNASIHTPSGVLNYVPAGATHVRFLFVHMAASNMSASGCEDEAAAGKITYQWTDYNPVTSALPTSTITLPAPSDSMSNSAAIVIMGVEFSQQVNNTKYPLQEEMSAVVIGTQQG